MEPGIVTSSVGFADTSSIKEEEGAQLGRRAKHAPATASRYVLDALHRLEAANAIAAMKDVRHDPEDQSAYFADQ
ncbi:hypothetical protein [Maricaulis sp.]|uniref:hypothetical protein n=1 Tax=Maricaulis sp. TaxID=1486257 RepID=UPI003A90D76F